MLTAACKTQVEPVAKIKSDDGGYSCDMAKSREATNDATRGAFTCAYKAIISAGNLAKDAATAQWAVKAAEMTTAAGELVGFFYSIAPLIQDIQGALNNGGHFSSDTGSHINDFANDQILEPKKEEWLEQNEIKSLPMYQCLNGAGDVAKKLVSLYSVMTKLDGAARYDNVDLSLLTNLLTSSNDFISLINKISSGAEGCAAWLNSRNISKESVQRVTPALKKFLAPFEAVIVVGKCGVDLSKAGYVLFNNIGCLAQDLKSVAESQARIDNMMDQYSKEKPVETQRDCMRKYGFHLYQKLEKSSFETNAYACAKKCGNKGEGRAYVAQHLSEIFPLAQDQQFCKSIGTTMQSDENINYCISLCCNGDSSCRDSSWSKLRYYDL
jgi:hypothetical protein